MLIYKPCLTSFNEEIKAYLIFVKGKHEIWILHMYIALFNVIVQLLYVILELKSLIQYWVFQQVNQTKYLGIMISDDLSPDVEYLTGKANRVLGLLRRNVKECLP